MRPFVLQMQDHQRVRFFRVAVHRTVARYCQLRHICRRCIRTHRRNALLCRAGLCLAYSHRRFRCSSSPKTCSSTPQTHRPLRCRPLDPCHSFALQAMRKPLRMPKTFHRHQSRRPCLTVALVLRQPAKNAREHQQVRCS